MLNLEALGNEQICIIGGSGRIGNKVMSMMIDQKIKITILVTNNTINTLSNKTSPGKTYPYFDILNEKISTYNANKPDLEHRKLIPENIKVYSNIKQAYEDGNRIFIFCGKNSDEVKDFLMQLKEIRSNKEIASETNITFYSIADRLINNGEDLNDFKKGRAKDLSYLKIFYHHSDLITNAGEQMKIDIEKLKDKYPPTQFVYKLYDFYPMPPYGKLFNTTRKGCRLLECMPNHEKIIETKQNMDKDKLCIEINENLTVTTVRYKDCESKELIPDNSYNWVQNPDNKDLPSIGIEVYAFAKEESPKERVVLFFKEIKIGLISEMAEFTCEKVINKVKKDRIEKLNLTP